jgi:DNA-binding transcriptional regulator of glucitol operon
MNDKQKLLCEQRIKGQRNLMISWVICFFVMPLILWKDISQLNSTGMKIFFVGYIITGGGIFCFFLHRYKKVAKENEDEVNDKNQQG